MSQVITNSFEQYWQSSLTTEQPVVLDEIVLADIPNLDITSPIDPDTGLPPEGQIVHRQTVDQRGRVNNNAVAYTIVMDTTIGDFSFNAMYLRNKQNGVIGMIVYKGRETKLKTDQTTGQTGNSLVKSMLMGYDQAAEATLTHVDAGTWQIDYAARLNGQDEDLRQLASQLYGHHTFIGDGFKVVQQDGGHQVTPGVAIVGGLRIELKQPEVIYPGTKPIGVWVDVHRAGSLLSEHQNHFTIITSVADLADHVDENGYQHYVAKLGTVQADGIIEDGRGNTSSTSIPGYSERLVDMDMRVWEALRRSYAEAGYDLVDGSFDVGGTVRTATDVLLDKNGKAYSWGGTLPKKVDKGSTPIGSGGIGDGVWTDRSSATNAFRQSGLGALLRSNEEKLREKISLKDFAVGDGVETDALNKAMKEAVVSGRPLNVNGEFSVNGEQVEPITTEVPMIGSGNINGPYRKLVVPEHRAQYIPVNTIRPSNHLKQLATTDNPVVVMLGDSISTDGPNSWCSAHSMWSLLTEKLKNDNPQKKFTFHNRAIGGQTWLNLNDNSRPAVGVTWWYATNQPWLNYAKELAPDVVFLAFGMNDSNGFNSGAMLQAINKIKAWEKVPDIILITNPVPAQTTLYPDGNGFGFRGQIFQDGRDYPAAYARNYANFSGIGLIDINRAMVAMRDCYDVAAGPLKVIATASVSSMVASSAAYDFSFRCVCNGALWPEGKILLVKAGLENSDLIFVKKISGNFVLEGFTAGLKTYAEKVTNIPVPAGSFGFEISVIGGVVKLIVAPTSSTFNDKRVIAEFKVMRHGGIFKPVIGWQTDINDGPFTSITFLSGYGHAKYRQTLLDSEIWGPSDITSDTKQVWGGNGINHFSARGIDYLVRPVIEACDFSASPATSGLHAGGRWIKHPDGSAEYSKKVSITTSIDKAQGQIFLQANPIEDLDFPAIFMSDGESGLVFQASIHVMSDTANFIWGVSSGSSKLNNAIRYRLASPTAMGSATVDVQITMRGRWK